MNCATCPVIVKTALNKLDGVESVQVSMADKTVRVEFDNEKVSEPELAETVTNAGFPAKVAE